MVLRCEMIALVPSLVVVVYATTVGVVVDVVMAANFLQKKRTNAKKQQRIVDDEPPIKKTRTSKIIPPAQTQLTTKKDNYQFYHNNCNASKKLKKYQDKNDKYQHHVNTLQGELTSLCNAYDMVQPKKSPFSTHHLIWVNYKVVSQLFQLIYLVFSYLNRVQHISGIELCQEQFFSMVPEKINLQLFCYGFSCFFNNAHFHIYFS